MDRWLAPLEHRHLHLDNEVGQAFLYEVIRVDRTSGVVPRTLGREVEHPERNGPRLQIAQQIAGWEVVEEQHRLCR